MTAEGDIISSTRNTLEEITNYCRLLSVILVVIAYICTVLPIFSQAVDCLKPSLRR